ncbi:MAG: methyltransferase domain-containing protein, partial [Polyangiaceae bacterium]|nr:methyltransferase domain-containing protein [Polyangiaceae bacterium]
MRLHLGCGDKRLPKPWINCDGDPARKGTMLFRLPQDLKELATGSIEWVYSSHAIEHVEFDSLPGMFAEFHRVIKTGGKLTLATIDINGIYHNRYKAGLRDASWNAALYGETWGMGRPFIAHLCCFDDALLS